ncbi:NYN domain-containing protein [Natranaerofaba carboxydovora]|uniref:NYN domain-containing protein n=1 Tax=Natranaerofaba carboxydovora TaxID=2742683 RepID=UPI001F13244F|nr:NYN domain-containing protein [Natranaerofaba carboxydovora]UMZ75376.1 YacP-like NYN domain protein [Natranaerofaba carboxydovora]
MGKYLIVDGYNIINAWQDLKSMAKDNLEFSRQSLIETLSECKKVLWEEIIVVFDAYHQKDSKGSKEKIDGIVVIYTKEGVTADRVIESLVYDLDKENKVEVATSDWQEQRIVLGKGAIRLSARELLNHIEHYKKNLRKDFLEKEKLKKNKNTLGNTVNCDILEKLEKLRKRKEG